MPGAPIEQLRGPTAEAYCVRVAGSSWWWNDAISMTIPREPGRP